MPTYYSKLVVDEVQALLLTPPSVQPINTTWKKIMAVFKREGIAKPKRLIHVKDIYPHPKNRGGMMLNGFNAQANASKIQRVGANRDELHGAVVIEMNPFPANKQAQIDANLELIAKSKGLIAQPFGSEWCLSLGTGHAVAFCRAALQGLRACFKNLGNDQGQISQEILFRDPEFKAMVQEGWDFEVLPWQVEATWSLLPEFAQRALNASNAVATDATEWEVAITIGETYTNMEEPDWNMAVDAAAAGSPQCVAYIQAIRKLVEYYGGGPSFPIILEQEEFYKTLGENKRLGEEFSSAIVDVVLDEFNPRLHVRHALIALNLTATKIVDGVVRFVSKSDISSLGAKDKKASVAEIDDELGAGRDFLQELKVKNRISQQHYTEILGLFRVRYGGFLIGKGEKTFEGMKYENKGQIVALFLQDVNNAIKDHDQPSGGSVAVPDNLKYALTVEIPKVGESSSAAAESAAPLTIEEVSGLEHAALKKGFKVGEIVFEKKMGFKEGIYQIKTLAEKVELQELDAFKDESQLLLVRLDFASFMKGWLLHKGDVPSKVQDDWREKFALNSFTSRLEDERCKVFIELRKLALENECPSISELVILCQKPTGLRAAKDMKKGDLVIYPVVSSITQVLKDKTAGAVPIVSSLKTEKGEPVTFYLTAPPQPKDSKMAKWKDSELVSPWKWLEESTKDSDVNMVLKEWKTENGLVVPYIENKKAIKTYERLFLKKAEKVKRKLEDAESAKPTAAGGQNAGAPSAKSSRV